ncbi:Pyrroline-5-carboxylate reductase [Burkholderiales bacterium 8X]|nr:Pyrroline-5-carboxylate reductase [Burkholderiales bacterium 8X]
MNIAVTFLPRREPTPLPPIAFIGGGNMATAILGGLLKQDVAAATFEVVEPSADARLRLQSELRIAAHPEPGSALERCEVVVWAVKPQSFEEAARATASFTRDALHLSIAAGIPSDSIAGWLGTDRVVRAMPNTPALVGEGMTGLFARSSIADGERELVSRVLEATGELLWLDTEELLDAVTALSGSGPAYVFYFIEAMVEAGVAMGLSADDAQQLAIGTFRGAAALAGDSKDSPQELRQKVTSKGGTTHAALLSMEADAVKQHFMKAIEAARQRAAGLAAEYGQARG